MNSSQQRPPAAGIFDILTRNTDLDAALYEVGRQYPEIELDYLGELLIAYRRSGARLTRTRPRMPPKSEQESNS